jgi:hypothetical protein
VEFEQHSGPVRLDRFDAEVKNGRYFFIALPCGQQTYYFNLPRRERYKTDLALRARVKRAVYALLLQFENNSYNIGGGSGNAHVMEPPVKHTYAKTGRLEHRKQRLWRDRGIR